MNRDSEEYHRLIEHHLSMLTMHGLRYAQTIGTAIDLLSLKPDVLSLSSEENAEIIMILKNSVKEHIELIEWSINDRRQKFEQG
jgi:hypothetical protein